MKPKPDLVPVPIRPLLTLFAVLGLGLISACGPVKVQPEPKLPVPLVERMPLHTGVYFSEEFRTYHHREKRDTIEWDVNLGAPQVPRIQALLAAMFTDMAEIRDLTKLPADPPLDMILEPRFEEYSFVTPRDSAGDYYAVTIKYRVNVMNGAGQLLDSFVLTGYGNVKAGGMSSEAPLALATQTAVRDAGAKFVVEFPEQAVVQKLLRGEKVEPLALPAAAPAGEIVEIAPPTSITPVVAAPAATPASATPVTTPTSATAPATTASPPVAAGTETSAVPAATPAPAETPPPPPPRDFPDAPTPENPTLPPVPKGG